MSYRSITIDDRQWTYKVGRSNVHLRDPNGKGHLIPHSGEGAVTPGYIARYAKRLLAGPFWNQK
jgi:hypothetical protein